MPKQKSFIGAFFKWVCIAGLLGALCIVGVGLYLYSSVGRDLPPVETLREVQLQIPLRVYTNDGELIAEYGEQRREPVAIEDVPKVLVDAILASEDDGFYSHPGVSVKGLARAAVNLIKTGEKGQGGSTITMQVARNFFLSREKTYSRKLNEIFLALRIERELTKDDILELYLNKIYLGNRSYGFAAASRVYYGKPIQDLNLAEAAMLAGLPKAPSRYNPIINPERALVRRNYVLRRLKELDWIDQSQFSETVDAPVTASLHFSKPDAEAHYVGEMARARIKQLYGDYWSTAGLHVYTTLVGKEQRAANQALRNALFAYEKRHGFTQALGKLESEQWLDSELLADALDEFNTYGGLQPAVSISVTDTDVVVRTADGQDHLLDFETDVAWARERLGIDKLGDEITAATDVLEIGDVINLVDDGTGKLTMVQEPGIEGALVAVDATSGRIHALVGGFDFRRSKFNRVTQARRQPGSTFKPFIYSAALETGDTAATIYNDAPVVFHDDALEGEWRPQNYSGRFFGPTRLREALVKSRNLVSIRVLREIGIEYAVDYAQRFGFEESAMPPDLSLALGSASVTPLEMSSAFSVFANQGYRIEPYFIDRIEDSRGNVVYQAPDVRLCDDCDPATYNPLAEELGDPVAGESEVAEQNDQSDTEFADLQHPPTLAYVDSPRVIEPRNAYIMRSMLQEVTSRGTGKQAAELGRADLGGKTGTTNNQLDAWFTGFGADLVATAWVGSDGLTPLGRREAGGKVALPMWIEFMSNVLPDYTETRVEEPVGIKTVRIDRDTGEPASSADAQTMLEMFYSENAPAVISSLSNNSTGGDTGGSSNDNTNVIIPRQPSTRAEKRESKKKVDSIF